MAGPIAVICAMEWELAHLQSQLQHAPDAADLVLVISGMGMVSAAASTQDTITRHAPRAVVNYGCAGAHRSELLLGDLVIGEHVVAYDNRRETPEGRLEYRGMFYRAQGEQRRVERLACDAALVSAARRVADTIGDDHAPWPADLGWPASVAHRSPRVVYGTVASADRWNRSAVSIAALVEQHDSLCEDMEAAAIGLVCASHAVPFLTIKDISNNELLRSTTTGRSMLEELGAEQVARRAARFTFSLLRELGS
ncbi:MAG TPA: 5'-methylthioadenosine/S-adenosylhomocysteine nucleosidase [Chloroflexota bacterium]